MSYMTSTDRLRLIYRVLFLILSFAQKEYSQQIKILTADGLDQ